MEKNVPLFTRFHTLVKKSRGFFGKPEKISEVYVDTFWLGEMLAETCFVFFFLIMPLRKQGFLVVGILVFRSTEILGATRVDDGRFRMLLAHLSRLHLGRLFDEKQLSTTELKCVWLYGFFSSSYKLPKKNEKGPLDKRKPTFWGFQKK